MTLGANRPKSHMAIHPRSLERAQESGDEWLFHVTDGEGGPNAMIIGVPKEIKKNENRVAITPGGVENVVQEGHQVLIETQAGVGSGFVDELYRNSGATVLASHREVFDKAELVLKVKEPLPQEYELFHPGQLLFTYLHLAPNKELTNALLEARIMGIAYETVQMGDGTLPLLKPMSEIAGRMSIQIGCHFLEKHQGGKGVFMGGVPGVLPGNVLIVGAGVVGKNAAKLAIGMGADVEIFDKDIEKLRHLEDVFGSRIKTSFASPSALAASIKKADLVIGAVLVPGARADNVITEVMVKSMGLGSVIVDVAIDQGGCVQTNKEITTHDDPIRVRHGVLHYGVANIPGAVAKTSTLALTNATLPYLLKIADKGWRQAVREAPDLAKGLNVIDGKICYEAVAEAMGMKCHSLKELL
jgi:alanine dehydrogenase